VFSLHYDWFQSSAGSEEAFDPTKKQFNLQAQLIDLRHV
jgi:hypothetical protein